MMVGGRLRRDTGGGHNERMLALPKHGFVLLAVPKVGSTALEAALLKHAQLVTSGRSTLKHMTAGEFERQIAPLLAEHGYPREGYEVTALVREPVSWVDSWWRYRSRERIRGGEAYVGHLSFDEFVEQVAGGGVPLPPQVSYLTGADGALAVDRLWRYDDLDAAFAWMRDQVGKKRLRLAERRVSKPRETEASDTARRLVEEVFAADVELYRSLG